MIGRVLSNRYKIEEKIGGGGMAVVYRAKDQLLHRIVAVKILSPMHLHDEDSVRKFRREAQAVARLSHFNIVSVYDVGEEDDIHYIVMECIKGKTLKDLIAEKRKIPVDVALDIAGQICDALQQAHSKGIVHRDIKPHNIMITEDGHVKVTDFGIAMAATSGTITAAKEIEGSVHYLSPEQARGQATTPSSDIYSLGVVMYEMMTGQVPFKGENPISVAVKHFQEKPEPPRKLNPSISVEVERIILKAMQRNEEHRYPDAASLRRDINTVLKRISTSSSLMALLKSHEAGEGAVTVTSKSTERTSRVEEKRRRNAENVRQKDKKKGNVWGKAFLVLLFLAAIGMGFIYWFVNVYLAVEEVQVPDVVGKELPIAESMLHQTGLKSRVASSQYNNTIPTGHVIKQDPLALQTVKKDREISLILSKGPKLVEVPDMTDLYEINAEIELANVGLTRGSVTRLEHESVLEGHVIDQNPRPQTEVTAGTAVDLVISSGPPPVQVVVPSVLDYTAEEAVGIIEEAGLSLGTTSEDFSDVAAGIIIAQEPAEQTLADKGSAVNIVVSKGPNTEETPEPGEPSGN